MTKNNFSNSRPVWFEISVGDLDRAIEFYENLLDVRIVKNNLLGSNYAFFINSASAYEGALVQIHDHQPNNSVKLFFMVVIMNDSIDTVKKFGGKVIKGPELLKQRGNNGIIKIGTNLIDGEQGGYISEIEDCEGNRLYLYSKS